MGKDKLTCQECYFHRNALCALALAEPCPTFRTAEKLLAPPPQPQLVPRPLQSPVPAAAAY